MSHRNCIKSQVSLSQLQKCQSQKCKTIKSNLRASMVYGKCNIMCSSAHFSLARVHYCGDECVLSVTRRIQSFSSTTNMRESLVGAAGLMGGRHVSLHRRRSRVQTIDIRRVASCVRWEIRVDVTEGMFSQSCVLRCIMWKKLSHSTRRSVLCWSTSAVCRL